MKILLSGASGLLGSALSHTLTDNGHEIFRLVRRPLDDDHAIYWKPSAGALDSASVDSFDIVIHLGGANLAEGRWTESRKRILVDSRVNSTRLLATTLASLDKKPNLFICASATGFYGDRGDELLTEDAAAGQGFLADLTKQWEQACAPAVQAGLRTVNLRFGIVLSPEGGALRKMLLPFKLGIAGKLGSGDQYWSWISLNDVVGAVQHVIANKSIAGPVNVTAPSPVTNAEFTKTLGRVLNRPTIFPAPAFALKLAMGEMADEALLSSQRVIPRTLADSGYDFIHADLETTLRQLLNRPA